MTARQRRRAVEHLKSRNVSERRACRVVGFSRSAIWRPLQERDDAVLRDRLKTLAERYPRYGCPTLHDMLRTEGLVLNHKRTYRIYCEESLQVRTKKRKKLSRPRIPMLLPDRINERWSVDFMSDQLASAPYRRVSRASGGDCFAMLSSTPTAAADSSILVPPELTNGSGIPFVGRTTVTTPMFSNA